jgi:hypothetical protein
VTAWVKAKATETNQVRYQKYVITIFNPPRFINHTINSVIANFTVNLAIVKVQLPEVSLSPSSYANLLLTPDPNSNPSLITIDNAQITSTSDHFKLNIGPWLITQIGNYQVNVSLENDQGKRGPYIVNITVINTPPRFLGKDEMSVLDFV